VYVSTGAGGGTSTAEGDGGAGGGAGTGGAGGATAGAGAGSGAIGASDVAAGGYFSSGASVGTLRGYQIVTATTTAVARIKAVIKSPRADT